jgi:Gpi18-like mannosyltransferase
LVLLASVAGLLVACFFQNEFDVQTCWAWAETSKGLRPWDMYFHRADCNYPPFILYNLTVLQAILNAVSMPSSSYLAVGLMKVPSLIAFAITPLLVRIWLKPVAGAAASQTACVFALCVPVWFDAAIWGQWEAFLCLAMLAAVIALWRESPAWSGAAVGWSMTIKPLAVMIVPALLVYCLRRFGIRAVGKFALAATVIWGVIVCPFLVAGAGQGVRQTYTNTVDKYPFLSVCAFNNWMLVQTCTADQRQWPDTFGRKDAQVVMGLVTAKQLGMAIFALFLAFVLFGLWRRPSTNSFLFAAGLSAYAFYMLPTEMHERYILPACTLFALIAVRGGGLVYLAVLIPATINQVLALGYENSQGRRALTVDSYHTFQMLSLVFSAVNLALFLWVGWRYTRQTFGSREDSPDFVVGGS